jgi:hypothetical protein
VTSMTPEQVLQDTVTRIYAARGELYRKAISDLEHVTVHVSIARFEDLMVYAKRWLPDGRYASAMMIDDYVAPMDGPAEIRLRILGLKLVPEPNALDGDRGFPYDRIVLRSEIAA